MKFSPKIAGFLQAVALTTYVSMFAFTVQKSQQFLIQNNIHLNPVLSIILFLLTFIISAIICGSIVFAYPLWLFFEGQRLNALKIVFWNAVWLIIIFLTFAIIWFIVFIR